MKDNDEIKSLGFKEMHPMQVEALVDLINRALNLACLTGDDEIIQEIEQSSDEVIHLFGGNGVSVKIDVHYRFNNSRVRGSGINRGST